MESAVEVWTDIASDDEELHQALQAPSHKSGSSPAATESAPKRGRKGSVDPARIVELYQQGKTQKEIAQQLGCSQSTVNRYLQIHRAMDDGKGGWAMVDEEKPKPSRSRSTSPKPAGRQDRSTNGSGRTILLHLDGEATVAELVQILEALRAGLPGWNWQTSVEAGSVMIVGQAA